MVDESLAANSHTAVFAFQYQHIDEERSATRLARSRPNLSVYARDGAVISGVMGRWQPSHSENEDKENIRQTYWRVAAADLPPEFMLGDFASLARFLAVTQAQQMSSFAPESLPSGEEPAVPKDRPDNPDA